MRHARVIYLKTGTYIWMTRPDSLIRYEREGVAGDERGAHTQCLPPIYPRTVCARGAHGASGRTKPLGAPCALNPCLLRAGENGPSLSSAAIVALIQLGNQETSVLQLPHQLECRLFSQPARKLWIIFERRVNTGGRVRRK